VILGPVSTASTQAIITPKNNLAGESEEKTKHHGKVSGDRNSPNCPKLEARLG